MGTYDFLDDRTQYTREINPFLLSNFTNTWGRGELHSMPGLASGRPFQEMESRLFIKLLLSLVSEDLYLRDELIATYSLMMLSYFARVHVETRRLVTKYGLTHLVMRILKMAPELFWRNAPKRYNYEEL